MRSRILAAVVVPWLLAGCTTAGRLRPTPAPQVIISQDGRIAAAEGNGVRLVASADTWKGNPVDLTNTLTPVEVVLENTSGRTLRVQYDGFELVGEAHYAALQPQSLASPNSTLRVPAPPPSASGARGRIDREPQVVCYTCGSSGLPTADMLNKALPEGVLKSESSWSGFLYFENLGAQERQVTLQARLVDASTGETFATLRIPFQVLGTSR